MAADISRYLFHHDVFEQLINRKYLYTVGLLNPHTRASSDTFILALVYITFRQYTNHNPNRIGHYVKLFPAFNFGFLFLLTGMMMLTGMR